MQNKTKQPLKLLLSYMIHQPMLNVHIGLYVLKDGKKINTLAQKMTPRNEFTFSFPNTWKIIHFTSNKKVKDTDVIEPQNIFSISPFIDFSFFSFIFISVKGLGHPLKPSKSLFWLRAEKPTSNLSSLMRSKDSFTRMKQSSGRNTSSIYSDILKMK